MKKITDGIINKMENFHQLTKDALLKEQTHDEDSDFGLLIDKSLYVKFDDKVKLAEMLKSCTRDQLTKVVQLVRSESNSEKHMIDKVSIDRFQLKIDQI